MRNTPVVIPPIHPASIISYAFSFIVFCGLKLDDIGVVSIVPNNGFKKIMVCYNSNTETSKFENEAVPPVTANFPI